MREIFHFLQIFGYPISNRTESVGILQRCKIEFFTKENIWKDNIFAKRFGKQMILLCYGNPVRLVGRCLQL